MDGEIRFLLRPASSSIRQSLIEWVFSPIDENLWSATFDVIAGLFSVNFSTEIIPQDWQAFIDQLQVLHDTLAGDAVLTDVHGHRVLRLTILSQARGQVLISGLFVDQFGCPDSDSLAKGSANRFEFSHLVLDQTGIREALQQFRRAM